MGNLSLIIVTQDMGIDKECLEVKGNVRWQIDYLKNTLKHDANHWCVWNDLMSKNVGALNYMLNGTNIYWKNEIDITLCNRSF